MAARSMNMNESKYSSDDEDQSLDDGARTHNMIVAGKAVRLLMRMENDGSCEVERESVYGGALVIPQVARSCLWARTFTVLAFRNYTNLALSYLAQFYLIYLVFVEMLSMDPLSGVMHLCSFGRDFYKCPDAQNCVGPDGGPYNKHNLMSNFGDWQTRAMVRDALMKIFPEKFFQVRENLDPGEFGLESWHCRYLCLFLFTMASANEVERISKMIKLITSVPTKWETWIHQAPIDDKGALVTFKVAGMPLFWKIFNIIFLVGPKITVWLLVFFAGSRLLIQTASIMDTVLNSLAVMFVMDIDEIVMSRLATAATKHIVENVETFNYYEVTDLEHEPDDVAIGHFHKDSKDPWTLLLLFPRRLLYIGIMCVFGVMCNYHTFCDQEADGSYVSKPIYAPVNVFFNGFYALFFEIPVEDTPTWSPSWKVVTTTVASVASEVVTTTAASVTSVLTATPLPTSR
jgi:hypothetical protein